MPAGFPSDIRVGAVERFLAGSSAREVCDWAEHACGRRPSVATVGNWVAAKRRGQSLDGTRRAYDAETVAKVVARRLTSQATVRDIAVEFDVHDTAALTWTKRYWPDDDERDLAASMTFDEAFAATMERVSKHRKVQRNHQQQRVDEAADAKRPPRPVNEWLPGPGPIDDIADLPSDMDELKKLVVEMRDRETVKDAIIHVLMSDGEPRGKDNVRDGESRGKDDVRDGELSTAAKAAVVVALTDAHGFSIAKACAVVGIAQSTFYYHRHKHTQVVQQREQRHAALKPLILQAAAESGQSYGYQVGS